MSSAETAVRAMYADGRGQDFYDCREAFVAVIKERERDLERWSKSSLKQHWAGKQSGFADTRVQDQWRIFRAGWVVAKSSEAGGCTESVVGDKQ